MANVHASSDDYQAPLHGLCGVCQYIVSQSTLLDAVARSEGEIGLISEGWRHYDRMSHLVASALQGCHLCSLQYAQSCTMNFEHADIELHHSA